MNISAILTILLAVAAIVWLSIRQTTWQPMSASRAWRIPLLLIVVGGIMLLTGQQGASLRGVDIGLLAVELIVGAAVGALIGAIAHLRPVTSDALEAHALGRRADGEPPTFEGNGVWGAPAVVRDDRGEARVRVLAGFARRHGAERTSQWQSTGRLTAQVEENYTAHAILTAFGRHAEAGERFDAENETLARSAYRAQYVSGLAQPLTIFVGNLGYVAVAVFGGLMVAGGTLRIGDVQAFLQYSRQFTQPLIQIASLISLAQSGLASAGRIRELLAEPDESSDPIRTAAPVDSADGVDVVFEDVSFGYEQDRPLIRDLALHIPAGSTVAIVGPTGAGKTTLVNLLMRFYDVDSGHITFNGVDTAEVARADLRRRVGMVLQDTWLFSGTIRENIAYGNPNATEEDIQAAAGAAYVDRFVHALPDGYDTMLEDGADNISVGERQLITIARAFVARPSVLILDEATSSVDTRTELLLQDAMRRLRRDRTSFVIAHRLSTIRDADLILAMDAGVIVQQCSHDELLAARGIYRELYEAQFEQPLVSAEEGK